MINVNLIYPVGSIYISINSKNPGDIFGGTWERIKGKMLVGVDEDDSNFNISGKTGGEKEVTLGTEHIPPHDHIIRANIPNSGGNDTLILKNTAYWSSGVEMHTNTTGEGQPHNNMPPYFTCYIWYRTA